MSEPDPLFRQIPAVDAVVGDGRLSDLPHGVLVHVARGVLEELRHGIQAGSVTSIPDVVAQVDRRARRLLGGRLRPVINATGIVLHTNLGRAPWPPAAWHAAEAVARGYANLELDLGSGRRGGRMDAVSELLTLLTGAERGLVVNNCAAAVLLCLTALARDREVIVSRGELVEIGGSFRVPDVIASGGARLREVGTTNRTRVEDYARAIGPDSALLLRAHPSNFRIVGFTEQAPLAALSGLARRHGLQLVVDQGSGAWEGPGGVIDCVAAGADVVTFSGDKLLGGPQAGFIVGRASVVEQLRRHPLYRALRVGKVTLAAVEALLSLHARQEPTPVDAMIALPLETLRARAAALCEALVARGIDATVERDFGFVGGGSLPGEERPTFVACVRATGLDGVAARLRDGDPAVVGRTVEGTLRLDPRTMMGADPLLVADAVAAAVHPR